MRSFAVSLVLTASSAAAQSIEWAPTGYLQAGAIAWDQAAVDALDPATGAPLNSQRFLVRRGRLGVALTSGRAHGNVELDANTTNGPQMRFTRALLGLHLGDAPTTDRWALLDLRLGLMPTPFGAELQRSSRTRPFIERSRAERALFPGTHDLGAAVRGQWRFIRYQVAAMNGSPIGAVDLPGQDPSASKDLMGRAAVVFDESGWGFELGTSVLLGEGFSPGTPGTKDTIQWQDANQNGTVELSELVPIAGIAGRPSEAFDRQALGLDIAGHIDWSLGRLQTSAELYWAANLDRGPGAADPVALGRDLRELGVQASLVQHVEGYALIGLRIDRYDPDADAHERIAANLVPRDRAVTTWSGVLGWTQFEPFRLFVQYDHEDNRDGRGVGGAPARLAADRLTLWAQVAP